MQRRKRFGEILLEAKVVSEQSLERALERQRTSKRRLGQILEEMGVVTERDIAVALARQFGFKTVANLVQGTFSAELLALIGPEAAMGKLIFPLRVESGVLYLAMVNPLDIPTIDTISFRTGLRVVPCVTTPTEIQAAIKSHYYAPHSSEAMPRGKWTLLVIDNQEAVRTALVTALRYHGFDLIETGQATDGLQLALRRQPHLIITDTVLPRMDGAQLFRALQGHDQTRAIPIIALSSKASVEEEARLLDLGFHDFLPKPVKPVRLIARVKRVLRLIYGDLPTPR